LLPNDKEARPQSAKEIIQKFQVE